MQVLNPGNTGRQVTLWPCHFFLVLAFDNLQTLSFECSGCTLLANIITYVCLRHDLAIAFFCIVVSCWTFTVQTYEFVVRLWTGTGEAEEIDSVTSPLINGLICNCTTLLLRWTKLEGGVKTNVVFLYRVTNLQDLQLALLRLGIGLSIRLQMKNNLHTLLWEEMQEEGKNTKW